MNCELDIRSFALLRHCHDPADIRISQPKKVAVTGTKNVTKRLKAKGSDLPRARWRCITFCGCRHPCTMSVVIDIYCSCQSSQTCSRAEIASAIASQLNSNTSADMVSAGCRR